jgi:intracellular septation protein
VSERNKGRAVLKGYSSSTKLVIKLVLEFSPLALFFLASTEYGFWVSTAVMMVATVFSLVFTWMLFRQLALMAIITAVTGIVAGAVTLELHDPMYIQMKPTIVSFIFAMILLTGQVFNKPLFRLLLGESLHLTNEGWRILTWVWFGYFLFITGLNEFIWRNYSWEFWAAFKAFGLMPLTVLFALPQMYLLRKYAPYGVDDPLGFGAAAPKKPSRKPRTLEPAKSPTQ